MSWARCLAIILASVCFPMPAIGQNETSPSTAENNESKPIEQITIIGKKPILTLFNQLEAAKIDLYSQYNKYNDIEKYAVYKFSKTSKDLRGRFFKAVKEKSKVT